MKTLSITIAILAATAVLALAAPDQWESLPTPPFPYGTSAGGGLATDGAYLYAADFSGDGNRDFIDLNGNNASDEGELLQDLGIPNGSVRFARYDPAAATWTPLPMIGPAGFGGDSFSAGNFNGSLFHAAGWLYYYQMRSGPERCVLHRYSLASAPGGAWEEVWNKQKADALISPSAGMVGIDAADGPVILHHEGGGAYQFCRISGLVAGGQHAKLTPDWPFSGAHFPRNGAWEFDATSGRLFHLSGNQLVGWTPSAAYPAASFLTSEPIPDASLAVFETLIPSLKTAVGWDPGGTLTHPGASLWGNSITVVNAPSGVAGGPSGEDTGANVLYLVRGETTPDGWPFNEGRGQITNGDFARFFPATGQVQPLAPAPFHVGKGSDSVFLDGSLYLTQGDTLNSPDDPGNTSPINGDGIRKPGSGFARFRIAATEFTGPPIIPLADYVRDGFATLTASPLASDDPSCLIDGDWTSSATTAAVNPAVVTVTFTAPTVVGAARAAFGAAPHEWTLDAADSAADLAGETGSFVRIFGPEEISGDGPQWQEWNDSPVTRTVFRFTIARLESGSSVEIRELELQRPKTVRTLMIGGEEVRVNHFEIVPDQAIVRLGESTPLATELSLSLGPDRFQVADTATWSSSVPGVATVTGGVIQTAGVGPTTITAAYDSFFTATAQVTVVDPVPHDDDLAVVWIQRLPVTPYIWDNPDPETAGWPAVGSVVTWRAHVRNWWPFPRQNVGYRWLLDGAVVATGTTDLAPDGLTDVDLPWTWTFDRHTLRFEIDPADAVPEFSETNNAVETWTDAITVGFWVEQSLFDYFHEFQKELGIGSNGWEDWAQRQVARWNAAFAAATHPLDAPVGVRDRIRLDKITVVPDGALPLNGGLPSNNPDNSDRTTDLVWGFPAQLGGGGMYANHTAAEDWNAFFYEGSLIHELGHARYLIDIYGFNIGDRADRPRVLITLNGTGVAGTPYMPRTYPWWDHVFYVTGWEESGPFHGLMNGTYTKIDRYSTVALNRIAGHRASRGNYNTPNNIGAFFNDLPEQNTVQLVDHRGRPLAGATVHVYQASGASGDWYGKTFDDTIDATFTADANGCVEVGRNPFTNGEPLRHSYGISHAIAILRADADGKTGFAFLPAGLFNLEYWRGNTAHGHHQLIVPMVGTTPAIADILGWPDNGGRRLRVIAGGTSQPASVAVDGVAAEFCEGAWWVHTPVAGGAPSQVTASWTGGPTLSETYFPGDPPLVPALLAQDLGDGLRLGWSSQAGLLYQLEHSTDLQKWLPAAGQADYYGTGSWLEADDLVPEEADRGFSRLRIMRLAD
ncbi:MAG: hypothetical protein K9N23_17730 [Akkermansiaceae bacterium]|nr:hypothetical protein [Akkermansiaceae bacterium]